MFINELKKDTSGEHKEGHIVLRILTDKGKYYNFWNNINLICLLINRINKLFSKKSIQVNIKLKLKKINIS